MGGVEINEEAVEDVLVARVCKYDNCNHVEIRLERPR